MKTNIYVSYHKPFLMLPCESFIPIHVGKDLAKISLPMIGDNTGDNISKHNPQFSDITTMYWAWKNDHDCDYVGFFHYRRVFAFKDGKNITPNNACEQLGLDSETINNYVKNYDIILPTELNVGSFYDHSSNCFTKELLDRMIEIMKEVKPEFSAAIDRAFSKSSGYFYNLFIMRRDLFDEFCEFQFNTLLKLEQELLEKRNGDINFPRLMAYLAERFINCYIEYLKDKMDLRIGSLLPVMIHPVDDTYFFSVNAYH